MSQLIIFWLIQILFKNSYVFIERRNTLLEHRIGDPSLSSLCICPRKYDPLEFLTGAIHIHVLADMALHLSKVLYAEKNSGIKK